MIKKIIILFFVIAIYLSISDFLTLAVASVALKEGDKLPLIQFPAPESLEERSYFGIGEEGFFTIPKIKANVVVIYFFSFYCQFCPKQVAYVNELYRVIDKNPNLKNKIKLIGIGIGNTPMEVNAYKKTYRIPFPLIPDTDFYIHKAYGEVKTPYFFVAKINEDGTYGAICCRYAFREVEDFLELILKKSDLKK